MDITADPEYADFRSDTFIAAKWVSKKPEDPGFVGSESFVITESDEIRLYNAYGTLFAVVSLWNAQPPLTETSTFSLEKRKSGNNVTKRANSKSEGQRITSGKYTELDEGGTFRCLTLSQGIHMPCILCKKFLFLGK